MLIFKDIFCDDEVISDSYKMELDGPFFKVRGAYVEKNNAVAGFEVGEEGVEDTVERVVNIVDAFRLQELPHTKQQYQQHIKGYLQVLKAKLEEDGKPEEAAELVAQSKAVIVPILGRINDFKFYVPCNFDDKSMVILCDFDQADGTPIFMFWRAGLKQEKY